MRKTKIYYFLSGSTLLIGVLYLLSPWLISMLINSSLKQYGFTDIRLDAGYPGWNRLQLHTVNFVRRTAINNITVSIPSIEIDYRITDLLSGQIRRLYLPGVTLAVAPASPDLSAQVSAGELSLLPILSGQWLAQLPAEEVVLDDLNATLRDEQKRIYSMSLRGQLRDEKLELHGQLQQISVNQNYSLVLLAESTGNMQFIVQADEPGNPILKLDIVSGTYTDTTINLKGTSEVRLDKLPPLLAIGLTNDDSVLNLNGLLQGDWQAQLPVEWSLSDADWQGSADLIIKNLSMQWHGQAMPESTMTAKLIADKQRVTADVKLSTNDNTIALTGQADYDFAVGNAQATVNLLPVQLSKIQPKLKNVLKDLPSPLEIKTGQIAGNGRLKWAKKLSMQGTLQLEQLGGAYGNINFAGLNSELPLVVDEKLKTSKPAKLQVDIVDVGFPVTKIAMQFTLMPQMKSQFPVVNVENFSAHLLGGMASIQPFDFNINHDRNAFTVALEHIGLRELVALEQQEGLTATGILDGRIPVELSGKEIVVTEGTLTAREPGGVIQYSPTPGVAAMAESNPSVGLMVKALSDFQYHLLTVNADYKPGGDLLLQVRLEGKNPGWQSGRPVNLNLNLQENIPALLRSLQLSDEISERVRKHYQKSP